MILQNNTNRHSSTIQPQHKGQAQIVLGWREITAKRVSPQSLRRRRLLILMSIILLITLIFSAIQLSIVISATNDQLLLHIGSQQAITVDLRQSLPISSYLYGTNIFPENGSSSIDQPFSGFMKYTPFITNSLQDMQIKLLRYPGGNWGEEHILSLDQLSNFSRLLLTTNSEGMLQVHLSGPIKDQHGVLQPNGMTTDLSTRANLAGRWVDYMNNRKSVQRTGTHAHDPYHPIQFWTVGNEPDRLINPITQQLYTVTDYVNAFIQFSLAMHQNDPAIKVFGPELSQFYGIGAGPFDAGGHPWMDDFLKGIAQYEQQHPNLPYHILDGISFHSYQFDNVHTIPGMILSSSNEWNYLLPPLRDLIKHDFGRDIPLSISEINTNPDNLVPSRGLAALWWADTLGTLMNQQVEYLAFFSASGVEKPYPLFTPDGLNATMMARVMQLFAHSQHNLIPLGAQDEPVSVYATQDTSHQTVSLLFVNKSSVPQLTQIRSTNQLFSVSPWHNQDISLAPYSIILVTLHRNRGAEAYSMIASTSNDATAIPLTYMVCGTKTVALANDIPC